jgi:hypothetical protein
MTTSEGADETEPTEHRQSRGIMVVGGDLRISELTISIGDDGKPSAGAPRVELRTDMWPFWLEEAIDAAVIASDVARQIPDVVEQLEDALEEGGATESIDRVLTHLVSRELRASMRAIASCAFAIDALYAAVKARSPTHPHQAAWTKNRTARNVQVADTFRHHLRIANAASVSEIRSRVSQIFEYRDWAVHPGARFREPEYRPDLNVSLDWHFKAFRSENAITATVLTVSLVDSLVALLDRGSDELASFKEYARRRMDEILALYDSNDIFPALQRAESPTD